ncbi:STAS domain-containing protein [Streptomyces sp. NPDC003038]|uniref:STAS domain-containing protein n=1 Tax=unclassified Streptomyces TaxID=2593676 RepID=UPI0033ABDCD1
MNTPISAPILPAAAAPESVVEAGVETGPESLPRIRSTLHDGVLAVSLAGEFDHHTCAPLRRLLEEGAARGADRLVLDAAQVTFCDSGLLHVLDQWAGAGRRWELATASRAVRLLLAVWARARRAHLRRRREGVNA